MSEINLLDVYPKANRNLDKRAASTPEDRAIAAKFGFEYFDGDRSQGYGGYKYDGRWVSVCQRFQKHYGLTAESKILDVGCAKGFMMHDFRKVIPGVTVAGLEISQYGIDNAMEDVKPLIKKGNCVELPFEDKSFDLVVCINTIHNLARPECKRAVQEIERVSRKNSFIVIDAYHNEEEKARLLKWNLTAKTHMYCDEWKVFFKEAGYTGDYYWFIP